MKLTRMLATIVTVSTLSLTGAAGALAQDPAPAPAPAAQPQPGIIATAETEGYAEWARGARATGFEQRLGERPYTVFIARDDAYGRVPMATRDAWRTDPARHRAAVGHTIVEGRLTAEELRQREFVTTIEGERLPVRTVGDRIMVGDATVERADIAAGPGVIHGVDRVLLPVEPQPVAAQPAQPALEPAPAPVRERVRKDPW